MSVNHRTLEALKHAYQEWHHTRGGSAEIWLGLIGETFKLHSLADGADEMPFTKKCSTKEEVISYFKGLTEDWRMEHYNIAEYIVGDDHIVARGDCHFVHRRTGKDLKTPKADIWKFENGKAVEFYEYYDTAAAFRAAS